jgi:hypothetical protein
LVAFLRFALFFFAFFFAIGGLTSFRFRVWPVARLDV